jgi:hypothetical protein
MRRCLLPLLIALEACFVTPLDDDDLAHVSLAVELPTTAAAVSVSNPWDEQDLFHLQVFPKYVRVAIELEDYERDIATWPDPQQGIGSGEQAAGEVDVVLDVEAGTDLRLRVLGFVADAGTVQVFREELAPTVDLVAGQTTDVTVDMVEHPVGSVTVSVNECQAVSPWQPIRVSLVDARAQVIFLPRDLEPVTSGWQAKLSSVPVGRTLWARVLLQNAETGQEGHINLPGIPIIVSTAGAEIQVSLDVSCAATDIAQ